MKAKLTDKQQRFVDLYLIDLNGIVPTSLARLRMMRSPQWYHVIGGWSGHFDVSLTLHPLASKFRRLRRADDVLIRRRGKQAFRQGVGVDISRTNF